MKNRINYVKVAEQGMKPMLAMEDYIGKDFSLDKTLVELIKIRVSQINGCAYCINLHTKDARENGETEQRIYLLNAWQETNLYTDREKMALKFAEKLTLIADNMISDTLYQQARQYFDEQEYIDLVLLINQIGSWNRISQAMGNEV